MRAPLSTARHVGTGRPRWRSIAVRAFFTACALSAITRPARAIPEDQLQATYSSVVEPWYFSQRVRGEFTGRESARIEYVKFEHDVEKGALVVLHGRGASHEHLAELFYDLRTSGWSVYSMDIRGQGRSARLADDPMKTHMDDWNYAAADVKQFLDEVVNARPHARRVLLGISLGGALAASVAQQYPGSVDALVLVSPMFKPVYRPYDEVIIGGVGGVGRATGQAKEYAPGQGPPPSERERFEDNHTTTSRPRFEIDEDVDQRPGIRQGGVTFGWLQQVVHANREQRMRAVELALPILLLQAGDDTVVMLGAQDAFCQRARDCRKVRLDGSRHVILIESDAIRDAAMSEITSFLAAGGNGSGCSSAPTSTLAPLMLMAAAWFGRRRSGASRTPSRRDSSAGSPA